MPFIGIGISTANSTPPPPKVKFDLFENGLDFIAEAVDAINTPSTHKKLKYALINLCSGVELILKEVLRKKDWRLLFQEVNEATVEKLQSGDFESVTFNKSIARLESQCSVKFLEEDKKILNDLRVKRNKIEHFKVDETVNAIKSICSKVLSIIIHFIEQEIDLKEVSPLSKKYITDLPKELTKFNSYVLERNQKIKPKFDKKTAAGIIAVKCPNCYQNTLFVDSQLKCEFCSYNNPPEVLAIEINKSNEENQAIPPAKCNSCSSLSLIKHDTKTICLSCMQVIDSEN